MTQVHRYELACEDQTHCSVVTGSRPTHYQLSHGNAAKYQYKTTII